MTLHKLIVLCIVLAQQITGQNPAGNDFSEYQARVNALETKKQYAEAKTLTQEVWDLFPHKKFELFKEMIYLNTKTGHWEDNLDLWAEGHQEGYFFLLNTRMPKYKPYLKYSRFSELADRDEKLRLASFSDSKTIYEVIKPPADTAGQTYPLIIVLHGGGSNIQQARERWTITDDMQKRYVVAFIQSYRHMDYNTFGWTSSDERAHKDIRTCFNEVADLYPVDTSRVIITGMSAGGTMAFDVAFRKTIPVSGVIAFCPGMPRDLTAEQMNVPRLKIYMLGGEKDFYLDKQQKLVELFKSVGLDYAYHIIPGMGHRFPVNYEGIITEALAFLTGDSEENLSCGRCDQSALTKSQQKKINKPPDEPEYP